jgi:hypothetical protein
MKEFIKYLNSFCIRPSKLKLKEIDVDRILSEWVSPKGEIYMGKRQLDGKDLYIRGIKIEIVD